MIDLFKNLIKSLDRPELRDACLSVVSDPRFFVAYGSAGQHHCYEGGLAAHTWEVLGYAHEMVKMFPGADRDVVLTAAIFHDYMKIREYYLQPIVDVQKANPQESFAVRKTEYRNLVRHVAGSHHAFLKVVEETTLDESVIVRIEHCILAHHGRFEWGSPIEPKLLEAHILHFADQFSALYGPTK
jgi:3'-5' exoribonuclease